VWGFLLVRSQRGHVFEFLTNFDWPWMPIQWAIFWLKFCVETRWSSASIESLIDLLACLEPKLWPKNPILLQNQKIAEKARVFHWRLARIAITRRENMIERELFKPSKDSWSLVVCTETKLFEIWIWGFRWVSSEWG